MPRRSTDPPIATDIGSAAARRHELMPVMPASALASGSPANNPRDATAEEIAAL